MYYTEKIIGNKILSYYLDNNTDTLTLITEKGMLVFEANGDCCSRSWIEHITAPKLPATILSIEEKEMGQISDHPEHDFLQFYSTIFKTDQGDFEVEYRNSSNGYYGGSLDFKLEASKL